MTLVILAYCPCCSLPKQSCGRFEHCLAEIGPVLMCENMVRESWPPNDNRRSTQPKEQHPVAVQRAAQRTGKSSMDSHINETIYLEDLEGLGISE
jgi:hypothetical protein